MARNTLEDLLRRAGALRQDGAHAQAAALYREALALNGNLPDTWYNLGWLERRLGRPQEALAAYDEALRRGVRGPEEVRLNRGVIYAENMNRPDLALEEYDAAIALNPRYAPAHFNKANLNEDLGRREHALEGYRAVLAIDPEHWEALSRVANAQARFDAADPLIAHMSRALQRNDVSSEERASLGFALGRARELAGDADGAMRAFTTANEASKAAAPSTYDRAAHERFVTSLIEVFSAPAKQAAARPAPTVFICGMFRSGSTLIEQVLGAYPAVASGGELAMLPAIARALEPFPNSVRSMSDAQLDPYRDAYRGEIARLFPAANIVTDKRPDNFLLIGLAKTLFPDARILHTVRDPVDTCLATYFLHLDPSMAYARDLDDIAHWYGQYRRLMAHWKTLYPDHIHDVDYDRFVHAPQETLEPALGFLGLEWDDRCLDFHSRPSSVRTASVWQVREPLYQRSTGRARKFGDHVRGLRAALRAYYPAES